MEQSYSSVKDRRIYLKDGLRDEEIEILIIRIKSSLWPRLLKREMPLHCGECKLSRICEVINRDFVCPWLDRQKGGNLL